VEFNFLQVNNMRKFKLGNKGITVSGLYSVALTFVVLGVSLGIGAYTLNQVAKTGGWTQASYAGANSSIGNATEGISKLAQWLPIIAIVIAAGVVIATLVSAFAFRRGV